MKLLWSIILSCLFLSASAAHAGENKFLSHAPMRPLPKPAQRPLAGGPTYFVDPNKGDDQSVGSETKPWQTVSRGVNRLKPGDTLVLRGGTYYEHVIVPVSGTAEQPITIRAYPGELAVIDGGLREFFENPAAAWEPCPDGAPGEFRSTKTYPDLGGSVDAANVIGNFGDSMVPLHGYSVLRDLRSTNVYFHDKVRSSPEGNIYCGPGLFLDVKTGRIHVRLAHTNMKYLSDEDNYQGETDPRKIPLVVAGLQDGSPLSFRGAKYLRVQDLVVRGARQATIEVTNCANLLFDGLTVYGGAAAFKVTDTTGLRVWNTACRGIAAPWTFRGSLKYRAFEARILSASGWIPTGADNRDFELAYSEFTDCVDGIFLGNVKGVHFHHNLVDNISDDGIFLTAATAYDGTTPGGDVFIYQNLLSRCLTTFAFGVGHGRQKALKDGVQTGAGVHIYRNVFDYRRPVHYHQPASAAAPQAVTSKGRFAGDHGSPAWEPMTIYHNTILADDGAGYDYGTYGLGRQRQRVFNNVVVQLDRFPALALLKPTVDLQIDGNLYWSLAQREKADFLTKFRGSKVFAESKGRYAPGFGARDRFADPKLANFSADWKNAIDLRLEPGSPAIDAGLDLAQDWPDPVRSVDKGKPDIGALPVGAEPWRVGVQGRLSMFGDAKAPLDLATWSPRDFAPLTSAQRAAGKPAAIVEGYPEFDGPLFDFALRKQGVVVDRREKTWLDTSEYDKFGVVVIAGDLQRAGIKHNRYSAEDLANVEKFMREGGTLLLLRRGKRVFDWTPEGQKFLQKLIGAADREKLPVPAMKITDFKHPWLKHLDPEAPHPWLATRLDTDTVPWRASAGERLISSPGGTCLLARVRVGKGQLIYIGWQVAESMPHGRVKSSVEQERVYEEQFQIIVNLVGELYPTRSR